MNNNNILLIAKLTFSEAVRGKILRVLAIISLILLSLNVLIAELYSWSLGKVAIDFGLSVSALTGLLIIFFLALRSLYNDIESHSFYFLFSRPVSKAEYVVGKYLGLAYILCLAIVIIGAGIALSVKYVNTNYSAFISPLFSWYMFFTALLFQALSLLIILSVVFFWWSFITESFVALILSILTYQIGQNMELIRQLFIESFKEDKFDLLFYSVALAVSYAIPNLSFFDLKINAAYGLPLSFNMLFLHFLYGLSYIFVMLVLSSIFFSKRKSL